MNVIKIGSQVEGDINEHSKGEIVTAGKWKGWVRKEYNKEHWQMRKENIQDEIRALREYH